MATRKNLPPLLQPGDAANLIPERSEQELIDAGNEQVGKSGEFTAAFLFKKRPEIYKTILHFLKEQMATKHICSICKVSHNTVTAVAEREQESLQPAKDFFLSRSKSLARLSMERLEELLPEMDARDSAIIAGIMIDKMLLLSGEATVIVAHKKDLPSHSDFNELINQLPQANAREVNKGDSKGALPQHCQANSVNTAPLDVEAAGAPKRLPPRGSLPAPMVTETPAPLTVSQTVPKQ